MLHSLASSGREHACAGSPKGAAGEAVVSGKREKHRNAALLIGARLIAHQPSGLCCRTGRRHRRSAIDLPRAKVCRVLQFNGRPQNGLSAPRSGDNRMIGNFPDFPATLIDAPRHSVGATKSNSVSLAKPYRIAYV